jgi:hypothetical protein
VSFAGLAFSAAAWIVERKPAERSKFKQFLGQMLLGE